jgi:4-alpha-glucanotransferase
MLTQRRSGILLHPTSLPGAQAVGSLGAEAYAFVDFLAAAGQSVWQILPLGPTGYGNCPYSCFSVFASNPLLINLKQLAQQGDLQLSELPPPCDPQTTVDYTKALQVSHELLLHAFHNFSSAPESERHHQFRAFCQRQSWWLDDYALFETIRAQHQSNWQDWPSELRHADEDALAEVRKRYSKSITWHCYVQFVFFEQWSALKHYANEKGILIFGDLPIFVAENSSDVWSNRTLFYLDEDCKPTLIAGVPPDYFSRTGQRWGNPLYRWDKMAADDYSWWRSRFKWNMELFDIVRIDHFRGFAACWAIPATEETAINGSWMKVPGEEFFAELRKDYEQLPIIAEDLGIITPDVEQLRDGLTLPGMKILQFAFDSGADNPYLPHQHQPNAVIYTGTHDNDTTLGWWQALETNTRSRIEGYLKRPCHDMPWPFIETAFSSVCRLAIIPLQDILSLPSDSRMNTPGTATGNWLWRFPPDALRNELAQRLNNLSQLYNRNLCNPTEL